MSPQTKRKIIKNIEARVLPISVIALLVLAGLVGVFVINPTQDSIVKGAATTQFVNYKTITIDHNQVPDTLHGYPFFLSIDSDSDLASDCVGSGSDIAFFDTDQSTQLAHEIEYFDGSTGELKAWINITTLSGTSDTVIYMYYNDSDIGSSAANKVGVWNKTRYYSVYHLNESSGHCTDSCEVYDGFYNGNLPTQQSSPTGYCQQFDNNDDWIDIPTLAGVLSTDEDGSVMILANSSDTASGVADIYVCQNDFDDSGDYFILANADKSGGSGSADSAKLEYAAGSELYGGSNVETGSWIPIVWSSRTTYTLFHVNGSRETTYVGAGTDDGTWFADTGAGQDTISIGAINRTDGGGGNEVLLEYLGYMDELRFLKINVTDAWANTVSNNFFNYTDGGFFTLGAEQSGESPSSFSLNGLTSSRITFAGTAGNTVWCNSTGDGNEWVEVNMSVNSTDNVTELRVFIDDLRKGGTYCNASNFTLFVSSDNSSYGVPSHHPGLHPGEFIDGGCNITINATTWNAGTMGASPFTGAGITDKDDSIYFIVRVNLTAALPAKSLLSADIDSCKVHIGYWA